MNIKLFGAVGALTVFVVIGYFLIASPVIGPTVTNPTNNGSQTIPPNDETSTNFQESAVLAGTASPLYEFSQAKYEEEKNSGKLIVLYFYANWCPICRTEFSIVEEVFNELNNEQVVAFRVNYNDSDTSDAEKKLASDYEINYQHTKVFVRNSQEIAKFGESWGKEDYFSQIINAL